MSHRTIMITISIFFFVTSLRLLKTVKHPSDIPQKVMVLFVFLNLTSSFSYLCQYFSAIFSDSSLGQQPSSTQIHYRQTHMHAARRCSHTCTRTRTLKYIKTLQRRRHRTFTVIHRKKKDFYQSNEIIIENFKKSQNNKDKARNLFISPLS